MLNALTVIGLVVNAVVTAVVLFDPNMFGLGLVMAGSLGLSLLGVLLVLAKQVKPGAVLIMIGGLVFVPIGLIQSFGGRKILDQLEDTRFNKRRNQEE